MAKKLWALLDIQQADFEDGFDITLTTDVPCHLFMRWTKIKPQQHMIPVYRRGIAMHADKYFCFDVYHDNEQEEAGDTLIHTFIKRSWPFCETRWFYFHGTIDGEPSPSTTAIFKKHNSFVAPPFGPEQTVRFFSDFDPEVSSVDGRVGRTGGDMTWAELHDGAGTSALPSYTLMHIRFFSGRGENTWRYLYRCIMTWDTREIPPGSLLVRATVGVYSTGTTKTSDFILNPAVYGSFPLSDTDLVLADYGRFYDIKLSDVINYFDIAVDDFNVWTLTPTGLASINKGGITRLGLRDSNFDAPNTPPPWENYHHCTITFESADFGLHTHQPYLEVTFREPG